MEAKHSKLCMDPNSLVRKGKFGDIRLFDSTLDEHIGFMDSRPLRAMYAEHVLAPGSQEPFSPPDDPDLVWVCGEVLEVERLGGLVVVEVEESDRDPVHRGQRVGYGLPTVHDLPGQHLHQHDAQRPDVRAAIDLRATSLFR